MVEHSAVNRDVAGSSPARGVKAEGARSAASRRQEKPQEEAWQRAREIRLRGQAVKTSPFHGGNTGSIPVGVICKGNLS